MKSKEFINFKKLKIESCLKFKIGTLDLKLNDFMDFKYSGFVIYLQKIVDEQIKKIGKYEGSILLKIKTDLIRGELVDMRDLILRSISNSILIDKKEFKHGEEILGIGSSKDLSRIDIPISNIMDLINYNIMYESIEIEFFDKDGFLYKPIINRKV